MGSIEGTSGSGGECGSNLPDKDGGFFYVAVVVVPTFIFWAFATIGLSGWFWQLTGSRYGGNAQQLQRVSPLYMYLGKSATTHVDLSR